MPWVLINGALRLRTQLKLDHQQVAKLTGLRRNTLRLHESEHHPRCLQNDTAQAYAKAYQCPWEDFVRWEDYERRLRRTEDAPTSSPPQTTLDLRAQQERDLGGPGLTSLSGETAEVLGAVLLRRCFAAYELYRHHQLLMFGFVTRVQYIPDVAADAIGAPRGVGSMFRIERVLGKSGSVYATVFTRAPEHTRYLMDCADEGRLATVTVRLLIKPEDEASKWKGFFIFEGVRSKPIPRPFCFVVQEASDSLSATLAPSALVLTEKWLKKEPQQQRGLIAQKTRQKRI